MSTDTIEKPASEPIDQSAFYTPAADIFETADALVILLDLPGVKPGEVNVTFEDDVLGIEAKVQPRGPADAEYAWQEYSVGPYQRSFAIRIPIQAEAISAELKDGVLRLSIPKAESAKTRRISIQS